MHGELGIGLPELSVIGLLDDYPTRSGYVITPVVLWGGADPEMTPNLAEVASLHRVAFSALCRSDSQRFVTIPESERPGGQLPHRRARHHAPPGAVLLQFRRAPRGGPQSRNTS